MEAECHLCRAIAECNESVKTGQVADPCWIPICVIGLVSPLEVGQSCYPAICRRDKNDGPDRWVARGGKWEASDAPIILRLAAHIVKRFITTIPDFSIVRKVSWCGRVIFRNRRTEAVGDLERLYSVYSGGANGSLGTRLS